MDSKEIIQLYIQHDESAINETDKKYRRYLTRIAMNILGNEDDCEECINDVYMAAWKSIPVKNPYDLKMYLARITKNMAIKMIERANASKRGGGQYTLVLEELEDVTAECDSPEEAYIKSVTKRDIESFLMELPELDRNIFVRRYWFLDKTPAIAKRYNISNTSVKVKLHRSMNKLKGFLKNK